MCNLHQSFKVVRTELVFYKHVCHSGLGVGGVLTFLRNEGIDSCRHFFDRTAIQQLRYEDMEDMMEYVFQAPTGSNRRHEEEAVARSWSYFLRATGCEFEYAVWPTIEM